jgi:hypothetical protein
MLLNMQSKDYIWSTCGKTLMTQKRLYFFFESRI